MFCIKCGVELSDGQAICPICNTRVYHPDIDIEKGKDTYPKKDFKSEEFNRKGLLFAITILMIIPIVLTLILEMMWSGKIDWSGYVSIGIFVFYVCAVLPLWFKRPNPAIFVPSAFLSGCVLLLYACFMTGGDWFLPFAMPITLSMGLILTAATTIAHYVKRGILYVVGGTIIAIGLWTGLLELLIHVTFDVNLHFVWSVASMSACFILGMFFIVVEIVKPFKESLRRVFYVG
jgi:hypothetical protein